MATTDRMRSLGSSYWVRVGGASVVAAVILTALFALAGHSHVSITLQSALVHAAAMTTLVSLTLPRVRAAVVDRPVAIRWAVKMGVLVVLALVGTGLAAAVITMLGLRPDESFWSCYRSDRSICVLITLTLGVSMGLYDTQRQRLDTVTAALRERELEH